MTGLSGKLETIASMMPKESCALRSGELQLSYASMSGEVKRHMDWLLALGSKVVALHSVNHIEWVLIDLACQELGLVFIPIPAFFTASQIEHCLTRAGVDTLLTDQAHLPDVIARQFTPACHYQSAKLTAWSSINPCAVELPTGTQKITFTSGSTGTPKGVCLSSEHQWRVAQSLADAIGIQHPKHLCLLPLSTLLENIAGVYTPLLCSGEVVIASDRERGMLGSSDIDVNALLSCIKNVQPNSIILVPQLLMLLVQACVSGWEPPLSLTFIAVGGGKISPVLIKQARQLGLPVYQGYGLSECGSVVALCTPENDKPDTVGRVLPHCEVTIEDNEIVVSGSVHLGYMEESSTWFPECVRTGDIGALDDGYLSIDGRMKNILITSFGRNISPEWVESVIMEKPFVRHCVVLGDDRPYLVAVISAPTQVDDRQIQDWINACNESLPDYARVGAWIRIPDKRLQPYITANGRPQREHIKTNFDELIDLLYQNSNGAPLQFG